MTTIKNDLAAGLPTDLVAIYNQVYVVNDWNRMHVWDGYRTSMVPAGLYGPHHSADGVWTPSPSAAIGAGSVDVGTHLLRYRYLDGDTQYPSNPTRPIEVEVTNANKAIRGLSVVASPDPKVDTIVLEMTRAGGDVFFRATAVANTTQILSVRHNDAQLAAAPLYYDDFGHDVPPYFNVVEAFRGRLWGLGHIVYDTGALTNPTNTTHVVGLGTENWTSAIKGRLLRFSGEADRYFVMSVNQLGTQLWVDRTVAASHANTPYTIVSDAPDVLFFSKPVFPQSWPPENQIKVLDGQPERARAIKGFRQDLVIFGERRMEVLTFVNDPFADGRLEPVQGTRGAANHKVVVDVGGHLYALDYKGIHRFLGGTSEEPEHISEFLDPYFDPGDTARGYVDFAYRDLFHAVHFAQLHQILFFVVLNGVPGDSRTYTLPQHAFVFDYLNNSWGVVRFDIPITCSTNVRGSNGLNYTVLGDANGYFWVYGVNALDGPPPGATVELSVNRVSGSKVFVGSTLYTDNLGLKGVPVYWPSSDVIGVVSQNSVDNFTLISAMGGLASGAQLYLGGIRSKLKSKAFAWWTERMKMSGRYLHLYYQPRTAGEARLRFYLERSTVAEIHSVALSTDGVVVSAGRDYATLDLTEKRGRWSIPMPHTYFHVIEWELEILKPGTELVLLRYEMDGYADEEKGDV